MTSQALVIIPCLNENEHLEGLLRQFSQDMGSSRIIVADGGSIDGSQDIVNRWSASNPRIVLMNNPGKTQSCGVNAAIKEFGGEYLWFVRIDAHCHYPDNYVVRLLEAQTLSGASSVVVPMVNEGKLEFQTAVALAQSSKLGTGGAAHRNLGASQFIDHGHHALISREAFVNAGGYCEAMICNEDAELDVRLTKLGYKIWLETSLPITYFPRSSPQALWRQYFRYGQGRARNVLRHKIAMKVRQLLPVGVAINVLAVPLTVFHPVFAAPTFTWLVACLAGGFLVAKQVKKTKLFPSISLAAGIMHLAWGLGFLHELFLQRGKVVPRFGFPAGLKLKTTSAE
jgi:succinoglycan biosynthesis protein ExoA